MTKPSHSFEVDTADFAHKVIDASYTVPVVVDFWADWCQPCRILKPLLEKLAAEYQGRFILAKINSDANQELASQLGVRGIPAVKAFVNGQMVDEFTGALPEAQVRQFLEGLIPSPAEPLRQEAAAARARGDLPQARELLGQALELDPRNEAAYLDYAEVYIDSGMLDEAGQLLGALRDRARDLARLQSLAARLDLAGSGGGDIADLEARLASAPDDLAARLQLANTLAVAHRYRQALEHLLIIVRQDRRWQDEAGRKGMLTLFSLLGGQPEHDDLVREFRLALARTLN